MAEYGLPAFSLCSFGWFLYWDWRVGKALQKGINIQDDLQKMVHN